MYEGPLQDLIDELNLLPSIGPKTAHRIAMYLLSADAAEVERLGRTILALKAKTRWCRTCGNLSERDECRICTNPRRDDTVLCVVEEPRDVQAVEKAGEYRGRYHVLGGALNPLEGIGPDDLNIRQLMVRLQSGTVREVILACNPTTEGEATASYLARLLVPMGLRVTRLAMGLPIGGDLEFADEVTLARAFEARVPVGAGF